MSVNKDGVVISQQELDDYDLGIAQFNANLPRDYMWGPDVGFPDWRWRATLRARDAEIADLKAQLQKLKEGM